MINTDLLPDAPVCSKLVLGYKAFIVTNTANTASMNRLTVAVAHYFIRSKFRFNTYTVLTLVSS